MTDPLWDELVDRALEAAPRYDHRFGRCPICQLGATFVASWVGVPWAVCEPCRTHWNPTRRVKDSIDAWPEGYALSLLAECNRVTGADVLPLPPRSSMRGEMSMRFGKKEPREELAGFDPRLLQPEPERTKRPWLYGSNEPFRTLLSGHALELLRESEHAPTTPFKVLEAGARLWERVRGVTLPWSPTTTVEQEFRKVGGGDTPTFKLQELIRLLVDANDVRLTLTRHREQIDRALEILDRAALTNVER